MPASRQRDLPAFTRRLNLFDQVHVLGTALGETNPAFLGLRGKMIVVESLWDCEALPWQADWYRGLVRADQGTKTDQNFRLWYTDHALHGNTAPGVTESPDRIVSYVPILQQSLRDVSARVEQGVTSARDA